MSANSLAYCINCARQDSARTGKCDCLKSSDKFQEKLPCCCCLGPHLGAQFAQLVKELRSEYAAAVTGCAERIAGALFQRPGYSINATLHRHGITGTPSIMQQQVASCTWAGICAAAVQAAHDAAHLCTGMHTASEMPECHLQSKAGLQIVKQSACLHDGASLAVFHDATTAPYGIALRVVALQQEHCEALFDNICKQLGCEQLV